MRIGDNRRKLKKKKNHFYKRETAIRCFVGFFIVWQIMFAYFVYIHSWDTNEVIKGKEVDSTTGAADHRNDDIVTQKGDKLIKRKIPSARIEKEERETKEEVQNENVDVDVDPRLVKILEDAGVDLTPKLASELPKWEDISHELFDIEKPRIFGLETCPDFVKNANPHEMAYLAPAGMFNTGTNILSKLLKNNCDLPKKREPHFQVPWGKHNPISLRGKKNNAEDTWRDIHLSAESVLPVVMIKDPYNWMGSICRHRYQTNWPHQPSHCPNLVPDKLDVQLFGNRNVYPGKPVPVHVRYGAKETERFVYTSMVHLWNEWNQQYFTDPGFPRIIIRYEDLLFHPQAVMEKVCSCIGGELKKRKFVMFLDSAKGEERTHKGGSGFLESFLRTTKQNSRLSGFHKEDLEFAKNILDNDIMQYFGYKHPSDEMIQNTDAHEE